MTAETQPEVKHRGLITLSIMLATIMQVLDTTIANVALPSMTGDLGASQDTINWVLTSYIVAAAIMTPVTGWLADRVGKRELFLVSIVGFVISSMACGLAWSLPSMVGFRLLQGVFGAAIVPLSQTFLLDINPREKAGQAMALWGAGIMVGPIIGPTLGGWLTESYNWRWVFFINLPIGIVALLGCTAWLPRAARRIRRFDFFGFAMLSLGIGALQLMLDRGAEVDWFSAFEIWIYLFLTLTGFWVFVIHILGADKPFLEPRMFADRNFATGLVFIFVIGIILLASLALLPPMLSRIYGYPVITTGLVMAPRGVGTMISMLIVGRLVRRVDARVLVTMGLALTAASLHLMTGFTPQMDDSLIIWSGVIQGLGLGLVFVPLSTVAFATIDPMFRADATSLFSLVRNIGSSIGISMVTVMLTRNTQINHAELSTFITPYNPMVGQVSPEALQGSAAALSQLDGMVNIQALMISYIDDFQLMMIITLAAMPLALLLRKPDAGAAPVAVHAD
ncbi:EmrB/QacA family drug resistance transporter [Cereibacter changlensis JA139]|uniref:EmrB/QacA family drug resistance transporter n=2 Tax=Cereibacter changlensis TaxID=402884 RepID=A0A2T4JS99_9RHOB|nr:DHA2 family efflux MFS transporter permease subunit [Cereibacter changlensis]PTE20790.1 EmrB/QacA family drug resistance transporter [Cereibacter changlensis JA139]PZX53692.1 DHA2 family multidrug resistance protein [Cereibacter changlensis]